jgi:hypothetical protein
MPPPKKKLCGRVLVPLFSGKGVIFSYLPQEHFSQEMLKKGVIPEKVKKM